MIDQFATYTIAKTLKDAGFDAECLAIYDNNGRFGVCEGYKNSVFDRGVPHVCTAPLWQQVIDWLREKHNIHVEIKHGHDAQKTWFDAELHEIRRGFDYEPLWGTEAGTTYEAARDVAILKALELIQQPTIVN